MWEMRVCSGGGTEGQSGGRSFVDRIKEAISTHDTPKDAKQKSNREKTNLKYNDNNKKGS